MRLVVATPLYPPEIGGPATYAKGLFEGLPGRGIEVEVIKFSDVRHLPKLVRHFAYYRRVLAAARKADAVLALDPVSVGLPAMQAAKKAGKPFAVKIVGDYAWEQGRQRFGITADLDAFVRMAEAPFAVRMLRRVQTRVARGAVRVLVPSEYLKKIISAWSIPAEKIEVIYNALAIEESGKVPDAVAKLPRPLVVTVGRLVPWKHIDGVIDAVGATAGASLAIVGDGPLKSELAHTAGKKLSNRSALTGQLSHADTLAVIKSADVFVLNSSYEGLSHLLIEALMLGRPIIATNVGGNPEVITHEQNGLLVPVSDTPALTAGLTRILSDMSLQDRLGQSALESAKRFSIEAMLDSTAAFLKQLA